MMCVPHPVELADCAKKLAMPFGSSLNMLFDPSGEVRSFCRAPLHFSRIGWRVSSGRNGRLSVA
eukprot:9816085-Lingulodinium_polyedra.AAC.1